MGSTVEAVLGVLVAVWLRFGWVDRSVYDRLKQRGIIYWWGILGGEEKVKNLYWEGAGGLLVLVG